ncbi:hypothetical protein ACFL2Q_09140 [Thermodesulfobacteriota bacterium]
MPITEIAWCSWCFKRTAHELVEQNYVRRNVYQCGNCLNRTLFCRFCKDAMARGHETWDDEKCAKCAELISRWGQVPDLMEEGWCSWCFGKSKHRLVQQNSARRNVYECESCGRRTLPCRFCGEAFSRGHATWDDEYCAKCDKTVKSWSDKDANKQSASRQGWCSWCLHHTNHVLEQSNVARRDVYICETCGQLTLTCRICDEGMTRGGPGWDDDFCAKCDGGVSNWKTAQSRVDCYFEKHRERGDVRQLLSRDSVFKEQAREIGMIRPFLYLVSMDPAVRNEVASRLGWSLLVQDYCGDPHHEAWDMINSDVKGLQARSHETYETLNPLARNSNWYEILYRMSDEVFKNCDFDDLSHDASLRHCGNARDKLLPRLEEDILKKISLLQMKHMSEAQIAELDKFMEAEEVRDLAQKMKAKSGIQSDLIIRNGINTVYLVIRAGGFNSYIITVKVAAAMNKYMGARIAMSQATKTMARFASVLSYVGWAWLAWDLANAAFGSSLGRAFPAVMQILNQRLFLAVEDIKIEDYY